MVQATVALVKELGGLNQADDFNLWRFSTPDELDAALTRHLLYAAARIRRAAPDFYTSTDSDTLLLLSVGESFLALHYAAMALKSRKVFGTHYPLDQEGSERFEELIDNEYLRRAEEALGIDLTTSGTQSFARPTFQVGPVLNRLTDPTLESEVEQILEVADTARSWPNLVVVNP
jgi:hypothetical protein